MPYQMRGWCLAEIQWSSLRPWVSNNNKFNDLVGWFLGDGRSGVVVGVVVVVKL